MNKFRFLSLMAWLALFLCASAAFAQSPTNISIVSGNGQLICQACPFNIQAGFSQLVVKVTDANGNPVAGTTVSWNVTAGGFAGQLQSSSTITDANGLSQNTYFPGFPPQGSAFQSFLQTTITASITNAATNFILTQGLQDPTNFSVAPILVQGVTSPPYPTPTLPLVVGTNISGQVGSTGATPIVVRVVSQAGFAIPNIAVNIFNLQSASTGPVVQCASGAGAGVGTVLTDATGIAVCNPVFGGVPGPTGQFNVVVGGVITNDPTTLPQAFWYFPQPPQTFNVTVTPGTPGALKLVSGNSQSAQAGQSLAAALVVEVDSTAGSPLAGQNVSWSVSPSGAATLGRGATTTTDATGQTSNTLTFATNANGAVQVTAKLASDASKAFTFTATAIPNITVTGLSIVSGNGQTAITNANFGAPLVVKLNANNGTAVGVPVQFSVSGPATLSASTVNTDSSGQASVTVKAGATSGAVTVTATASGFSQSFNLTVAPPGPTLTTGSFLNGADFAFGSLSPCSIATIIAPGLAPGLQTMVTANNIVGPLQTKLAGDTVTVGGATAPIYSVGRNANGQEQLTFQVPCDVTPGSSVPVTVAVGPGSASINIPIQQASPGIFLTQFTDNANHPVLVRPDGSFVSLQNPARKGESLIAFATGLGPTNPPIPTNAVPAPGSTVKPTFTVIAGMGGGGVSVTGVQASSDLVGVWMITFQVPSDVATGNVSFSIGVVPTGSNNQIPSATATIPVQ